jgi:Zn-dependent protease
VFLAVAVVAVLSLPSPLYAAVAITSYLAIITLHEFGHAYAAHRFGYKVEAVWITFFHGRCEFQAPDYEAEGVWIAWAGVLAQLAVAVPALVAVAAFDTRQFGFLAPAVVFLGYVNLLIALVNLAPAEGLDGKIAWRVIPLMFEGRRSKRTSKGTIKPFRRRR